MDLSASTALLLVDMVNPFKFKNGEAHARIAREIAPPIAILKARVREAGGRCIYVNDNFGSWRSNFLEICERARNGLAPEVMTHLEPEDNDLFVLKPRHSAFLQTPLPTLLDALGSEHLVIAGITADACVLMSALDAHMRGFDVQVPADCTAALSEERKAAALLVMNNSNVATTPVGS